MATVSEMAAEVKELAEKFKDKPGNLIMVLHALQNRHGYVPRELAIELSKALAVPLARIYEVLTFYNYFKLDKPGKHRISVCMGTACYLKGAEGILNELKEILNVKEGGITPDGQFHLDVVRCLGCCGLAPVIMIDEKIYGKVKKSELTEILAKYGQEEHTNA